MPRPGIIEPSTRPSHSPLNSLCSSSESPLGRGEAGAVTRRDPQGTFEAPDARIDADARNALTRSPPPSNVRTAETKESPDRRRLAGRVRVVVRCRPLIRNEEGHASTRVHVGERAVTVNDVDGAGGARQYTFDAVLGPQDDQGRMFAEVEPLVDHVLDGFHATVFAYGQTGSGKTHTMEGLEDGPCESTGPSTAIPSAVADGQQQQQQQPYSAASGATGSLGSASPTPQDTALCRSPSNSISASCATQSSEALARVVPPTLHGIMPRVVQLLFERARVRQLASVDAETDEPDEDSVQYSFRCSYYQIYNEVVTDLLRPIHPGHPSAVASRKGKPKSRGHTVERGEGLKVRWQKDNTFRVQNLFMCECDTASQMREVLFDGVREKVVARHLMNDQSSRSHGVFTVYVECRKVRSGDLVSRSEFSLVDLAGSEKIGLLASNPTARLMKESIDINTSLLALGKVITALATNSRKAAALQRKRMNGLGGPLASAGRGLAGRRQELARAAANSHVPYRDSKLTMLLKHALGGNSLTTMVACISPSDRYVEETVSTLMYAGRASNIENVPQVNEDPSALLVRQLREEIRLLKEELHDYRAMAEKGYMGAGRSAAIVPAARAASERDSPPPAALQQQTEDLADSLLTACGMLQQAFRTNGQLRDAYDVVQAAKETCEVREVQLNAENIALRERIQALESIVLDRKSNEMDDDDDTDGDGDEKPSDAVSAREHRRADRQSSRREDSSTVGGRESNTQPAVAVEETGQVRRAVAAKQQTKSRETGTDRKLPKTPKLLATSPAADAGPLTGPRRATGNSADSAAVSSPRPPPLTRTQRKTQERRHRRQQRRQRQRLQDYENRYRGGDASRSQSASPPGAGDRGRDTGDSYAAYYGRAAKKHVAEVDVASPVAVRRQLLTTHADMQHVVSTTVVEVQALLKKLPPGVAGECVPSSLTKSRNYGALAFCGDVEEVKQFEDKRKDRESRRAALLQRQQELLHTIHEDVSERRFLGPRSSADTPPEEAGNALADVVQRMSTERGSAASSSPPHAPRQHRDGERGGQRSDEAGGLVTEGAQRCSSLLARQLRDDGQRQASSGQRTTRDGFSTRESPPSRGSRHGYSSPYEKQSSRSRPLEHALSASKGSAKATASRADAKLSSMDQLLRYLRANGQ